MYISLAIMAFTTNLFVIGAIIATVYFLLKFLEMRFVDQDDKKPIKVLIRDTLIVCISSVVGVYLLETFKMFDSSGLGLGGDGSGNSGNSSSPAAFVDTPGF